MSTKIPIHAIFANYCSGAWVSYTLMSLLDNMRGSATDTHAYVLGRGPKIDRSRATPLLANVLFRARIDRLLKDPTSLIVRRFRSRFSPGEIVYFWLDSPVAAVRMLQRRGLFVAREMINCTWLRRRRELRAAYDLLGQADASGISDEMIEREREQLLAADAVFCPNDFVLESVLEYGVPKHRCIATSYGWGEDRILEPASEQKAGDRARGIVVLFVGTGDVRKGLPWLLEAWRKAEVKGELRIAGVIDPEVRARYAHILARDDVRELGWVEDVGGVYRSADVFCFPSWEEGGPLVTIEAMACGLPCVVTPMGGGAGIVRDSRDGIVVRPGDAEGIAAAFVRLASDDALRREMGERARITAREFTWQAVGHRRADALLRLARRA